ncbi:TonB-dependent receptor [Rhabdobacter roseus]|uniref:TonB-linked SusC/RagA family outer membrane protein n=1 Tax=Rhabdobacter roseus TaxID=1655419 RepID=A0A840TQP0_9BACT|nr:TonB-dependent receptor [Rhabdobacter roseus]MBB5286171.1 TonB-linked SusC/RagA family outer membrane protein [Rhabdobacter roseus]
MKHTCRNQSALHLICALLSLLLSVGELSAQTKSTVSGRVTSEEDGGALIGATITEKGTTNGTTTDVNGNFRLDVASNGTLVFSFIGYDAQEIRVENRTTLNVILKADQQQLQDVVVVGYGTQRKKDVTGSIVNLTTKDLVPIPSANSFDQMMQGKVAGVQITQTSGAPGGNVNVLIRGVNSITGGNQPLYVVDGYAIGSGGGGSDLTNYSSGSYSTSGIVNSSGVNRVNPLSTINPADIESIQVLKDASATAIYGSRGANGVVIINTKRGRQGRSSINFEHSTGIQEVAKKLDLMTPRQYAQFVADGRDNAWVFAGGNASDPNSVRSTATQVKPEFRNLDQFANEGYGTDWQDVIFRKAVIQNYQLSAMGNKGDMNYFVSGGFLDQDGIIIGSTFKKFNLRTNLDVNLTPRLKLGASVAGTHSYGDFARAEGHLQHRGLLSAAVASDPTIPIYDANGNYYSEFSSPTGIPVEHVLLIADEFSDKRKNSNVFMNNYVEYEIANGLVLKSSVGVNYNSNQTRLWKSSRIGIATSRTGAAIAGVTKINSLNWLNENTLNYRRRVNEKHDFDALVGFTAQKNTDDILQAGASDFPTDDVPYLAAGVVSTGTDYMSEWSMLSWLARINYSFGDKYLLTATIRRDGSSRFGAQNKWGTFPSLSAAYRVSEENFMKGISAVSDLKIRASYGISGNNLIGNYASQGLLGIARTVVNGQVVSGITPSSLANDQLNWEKSFQTNLGLDLALFQNRVSLTVDAYRTHKKDLLLTVTLPAASGFSTSLQNIGELENKGLEFTLNTENIAKGSFRWSTDANLSFNRNKVLALNAENARINTSDYQVAQVGYPISSFRLLNILGVFQTQEEIRANPIQHPRVQPGDYRFQDADGNGTITQADRTIVGNPWPKFTWGMGNRFSFKNLTLSVNIYGSQGNDMYFQGGEVSLNGAGVQNQLAMVADRWRSPEEPGAGVISRAIRNDYAFGFSAGTTKYLFDGSFVRIRNVNLSYAFPRTVTDKLKLQGLAVYADGTNLFTFTKYPGYDPEGSTGGDNIGRTGVDFFAYPNPRTYTAGLRVTF